MLNKNDNTEKPKSVDRLTATIEELIYAFENRIPILNMLGDATHRSPHIDEISCISAFRETPQGQKMFPNCGTEILLATEIEFEKKGYDGQKGFFKALKDGYRMLGTCGGAFDEHYMDPKTRRSSFQLVYDYLELGKELLTKTQFQAMLNYINQEDRRGALLKKINVAENDHASKNCLNVLNAFGEIPGLLKDGMLAHQFDSESQIELINAMLILLKGKLTNQAKYAAGYHQLCESTFRFVSLDFLPPVFDKKQQPLKRNAVIIMSNEKTTAYISKHAHQYFRNQHPDKHIDIFIYINGQNQVQIMPAPGTDPKVVMIQELVPIMRANIAQLMDKKIPQWNDLRTEHDPLGLLFFHKESGSLFNGSNTQYDTRGIMGRTGYYVEHLQEDVVLAINQSMFASAHAEGCKAGVCIVKQSNGRVKCPLYAFGLQRCHDIRNNMPKTESKPPKKTATVN